MNNQFTISELQPETIGTIQSNKSIPIETLPETPPEVEKKPEVPSSVSKEQLQEMGTKLAEMAVSMIEPDFKTKLDEKDNAHKETITQKTEGEKAFKETQKKTETETKQKSKETETKHKMELKGKDTEIASLKKQIAQKEKELKGLFKQVKEALDNE